MRRVNLFLSIPGILFLAILLAGLGAAIWFRGGEAFSPGTLTRLAQTGKVMGGYSTHADFEQHCELCHQPLRTTQAELCLNCHTNVRQQISTQTDIHGKIPSIERCNTCHPDHRGSGFSPARVADNSYDHSWTRFNLINHQVNYNAALMTCVDCHDPATEKNASSDQACINCHGGNNPTFMVQHLQDFNGGHCLECHDGADRVVNYNHSSGKFPLSGQHATLRCAQCHTSPANDLPAGRIYQVEFANLSTACNTCHPEPAQHQGVFPSTCETCHTADGWSPASLDGKPFDHLQIGFSLARHQQDYNGNPLTCEGCHPAGLQTFDLQTCSSCHSKKDQAFIKKHTGQFGLNCLLCHDGADRLSQFNHSRFFILDGKHADIACSDCHGKTPSTAVYRNLSKECVTCHVEPQIHFGFFGRKCQDCHSTTTWSPAKLKQHNFPLNHGGQGEIACQVCHPTSYVEYTCYGCHDHQPEPITLSHTKVGIKVEEIPQCTNCHADGTIKR